MIVLGLSTVPEKKKKIVNYWFQNCLIVFQNKDSNEKIFFLHFLNRLGFLTNSHPKSYLSDLKKIENPPQELPNQNSAWPKNEHKFSLFEYFSVEREKICCKTMSKNSHFSNV